MLLFTFIITPAIFKSFTRDMAGEIVGKLFPGYFTFTLVIAVLSGILLLVSLPGGEKGGVKISLLLIVIAVAISASVNFKLHPEMRKVKQEIASFETTSSEDPLRKKFRRLHAVSAVLNLSLLADGVALLAIGLLRK
jgi:hypothetical protein